MNEINLYRYLSKFEWGLLLTSIFSVLIINLIFPDSSIYAFLAAIIGCIYLVFLAKGNYMTFILIVAFSLLYMIDAYQERVYTEIFNNGAIEIPFALLTFLSWRKMHSRKSKYEVKMNKIHLKEILILIAGTAIGLVPLYFAFKYLGSEDLILSLVAIGTHFIAAYLLHRRSKFYAIVYIVNDFAEIVLWFILLFNGGVSAPILVLYFVFLANDIYGFYNWKKIERKQTLE